MIKMVGVALILSTVFFGGAWASKQYSYYSGLANRNDQLEKANQQLIKDNQSYIKSEQQLSDYYQKELKHVQAREANNKKLREELSEAQKSNLAKCRIPTKLLRLK